MSREALFYNELEELIDTVIKSEKDHVIHGLLIFNLDNFAEINNLVGIDGGNEILDVVSGKISEFFKGTDIVAKLHGDEYVVLARNLRAVTDIEKLCEKILASVAEIYVADMQVTSSIGVAVYPFHGKTYSDLLANAYKALIRAKANGKNGYRIFESAITKVRFSEYILNGKYGTLDYRSISASDWDRYFLDVCRQMFRYDSNIYASLNSILEIFCLYHGFCRAFIVTNAEHNIYDEKHMEFAMPGFEYPGTELIELLKRDLVSRLHNDFDDCAIVNINDTYTDPEIIGYMELMGDCELVFFSINDSGKCIGGVVYEKAEDDGNHFSMNELARFSAQFTAITSYALISSRFRASKDMMAKIEMFEGLPAEVYMIDSQSHMLEYMNSRALDAASVSAIGTKCYKTLHNSITVCEDCPFKTMNPDDPTASYKAEAFNYSTNKLCMNMYSWVSARDNKGKALMISVDVEDLFGES